MTIDIEKILTISAKEWFELASRKPCEYEAKGVHENALIEDITKKFSEMVPSKAEVVVRYRVALVTSNSQTCAGVAGEAYASGTALIPKLR